MSWALCRNTDYLSLNMPDFSTDLFWSGKYAGLKLENSIFWKIRIVKATIEIFGLFPRSKHYLNCRRVHSPAIIIPGKCRISPLNAQLPTPVMFLTSHGPTRCCKWRVRQGNPILVLWEKLGDSWYRNICNHPLYLQRGSKVEEWDSIIE